jgi:prepilin-type N-terminal cleavage/methylation domain-containing protein/prepilin-type processing-associated H-X9-DG protein
MPVEDLKLWHWMVLGTVLGAIVGYASTFAGTDRDPVMRAPVTAQQFADLVTETSSSGPLVHDVIVHPQHDGKNFVTLLYADPQHPWSLAFYADAPFEASGRRAADVRAWLDQAKAKDPKIPYSYASSETTWFLIVSRALGGFIIVGCLWPVLLNLMIGAGLGRRKAGEIDYDLDRFTSEPADQKNAVTSADLAHLNDVEHELEENLKHPSDIPATSGVSTTAPVRELNNAPLEPVAAPAPEEDKDYRGEFYPVAHPHQAPKKQGFSLVELIVVIGIIAILMAMLLPALKRVRQQGQATACANNLRQIGFALQNYLNENKGVTFWRADNINTDGMDWYAYGGRETQNLNLDQANYFNRIVPRPLNKYVQNQLEIFRCPCDDAAPWTTDPTYTIYFAPNQFEWVGNSYQFNANGYPLRPLPRHDGGLDAVRYSTIKDSSDMIVFLDGCLYYGFDWHYGHKGNIAFADGHVSFLPLPPQNDQYHWDP